MRSPNPVLRETARIEDLPAMFRETIRPRLAESDTLRLLAHAPAFETLGRRTPSTVLAITGRRWMVAADDRSGRVSTVASTFEDTLLLEVSRMLLASRLRIAHGAAGIDSAFADCWFHLLSLPRYLEAANLLLLGIDGQIDTPSAVASSEPQEEIPDLALLAAWPIKFRNVASDHLPRHSAIVAAARWPAAIGRFRRELAPAGALVATDRVLMLVTDERASFWTRAGGGPTQSSVTTFLPLSRLAGFQLDHGERMTTLRLRVRAAHGGVTHTVTLPTEHVAAVARVLNGVGEGLGTHR